MIAPRPTDTANPPRPVDPLRAFLADPRVTVDRYLIRPTNRTGLRLSLVHTGDGWWAIRLPGVRSKALNRRGEWVAETRNSRNNRARRYSLVEALSIALWHVDRLAEEATA